MDVTTKYYWSSKCYIILKVHYSDGIDYYLKQLSLEFSNHVTFKQLTRLEKSNNTFFKRNVNLSAVKRVWYR